MKQEEFNKIYPKVHPEVIKERFRRELKVDLEESSPEEIDWAIKKAKAKYKEELENGT